MAKRPKMTGQPKDAIALLKADHQKVRQLFAEYDAAGDRATRRSVATLVFVELETHAQLEEHVSFTPRSTRRPRTGQSWSQTVWKSTRR